MVQKAKAWVYYAPYLLHHSSATDVCCFSGAFGHRRAEVQKQRLLHLGFHRVMAIVWTMPRRSILSSAARDSLFVSPDTQDEIIRYYTLTESDLAITNQHRGGAYLERAIQAIRDHGQPVDENLLQHVSPLGWERINLTGDYVRRQDRRVERGEIQASSSVHLVLAYFIFRSVRRHPRSNFRINAPGAGTWLLPPGP
jgi:hypothetical protein